MFDIVIVMPSARTVNQQRIRAEEDPALAVTDATIVIDHAVAHVPAKVALQLLEFARRRLDASEARILADRYDAGASDSDVEDMIRSENNTSKAEATRRAKRAKATNANPDIANRMSDGSLSTEQADVIASAAADTDGEAACDDALIDEVSATSPEQAKRKARKYVNERRSGNEVQTEHDRQTRNRCVYRYRTAEGDHVLAFQGSKASIDRMERRCNAQADREYRNDGGRDVPSSQHRRTNDQRRFDAAEKLICNDEAHTARPASTSSVSTSAASSSPTSSERSQRRSAATIIITTVADLADPKNAVFTTADGEALPRSIVEELMWDASWIGQVYSAEGELLWQGRQVRYATPAQITGLIARDGGCVLCSAHYDRCEAHHCDPWEAPMQGETNIDRLALLCKPCHIDLHQRRRTLFYDRKSRTWKTRPALWQEIPPDRPAKHDRPESARRTQPRLHEMKRNKLRNDPHGDRRPLF